MNEKMTVTEAWTTKKPDTVWMWLYRIFTTVAVSYLINIGCPEEPVGFFELSWQIAPTVLHLQAIFLALHIVRFYYCKRKGDPLHTTGANYGNHSILTTTKVFIWLSILEFLSSLSAVTEGFGGPIPRSMRMAFFSFALMSLLTYRESYDKEIATDIYLLDDRIKMVRFQIPEGDHPYADLVSAYFHPRKTSDITLTIRYSSIKEWVCEERSNVTNTVRFRLSGPAALGSDASQLYEPALDNKLLRLCLTNESDYLRLVSHLKELGFPHKAT